MSEILSPKGVLVLPHGDGPTNNPLTIDLASVYKAEARLFELQSVTRLKAGELLHTFIRAWSDARTAHATVQHHLTKAKRYLKRVRGLCVLDRAAAVLEKKGLASSRSPAGSEDLRDAVVSTDADYLVAADRVEQLQAALDLLETKAETLKMGYFSVQTVLDPRERHVQTSGDTGTDDAGTMTPREKAAVFIENHGRPASYGDGFGGAKL